MALTRPVSTSHINKQRGPTWLTRSVGVVLGWITGARRWRWIAAVLALFVGIAMTSVMFAAAVTPTSE